MGKKKEIVVFEKEVKGELRFGFTFLIDGEPEYYYSGNNDFDILVKLIQEIVDYHGIDKVMDVSAALSEKARTEGWNKMHYNRYLKLLKQNFLRFLLDHDRIEKLTFQSKKILLSPIELELPGELFQY